MVHAASAGILTLVNQTQRRIEVTISLLEEQQLFIYSINFNVVFAVMIKVHNFHG